MKKYWTPEQQEELYGSIKYRMEVNEYGRRGIYTRIAENRFCVNLGETKLHTAKKSHKSTFRCFENNLYCFMAVASGNNPDLDAFRLYDRVRNQSLILLSAFAQSIIWHKRLSIGSPSIVHRNVGETMMKRCIIYEYERKAERRKSGG